MKVTFNQTPQVNKIVPITRYKENLSKGYRETSLYCSVMPSSEAFLASMPNISFGSAKPDMNFLLSQAGRLKCAYSGRDMISPYEIRTIYSKLTKRPNAQSAINFLQNYEKYMYDAEKVVFEKLKGASHKGKRNFQNILQELLPESLISLRHKQISILNGKNNMISTLSPNIAKQVIAIRDLAIKKVEDDTFGRKMILEQLNNIKAKPQDVAKLKNIYKHWYKLPSSSKDFDAFVVKYADHSHEEIAKRLLSPSVATIEHIRPSYRGGEDKLGNFLLVAAVINNERNTMPLKDFILLNKELNITENLQKYMDTVVREVGKKNSSFSTKSWYPDAIKEAVEKETDGFFSPMVRNLQLTKVQKRYNNFSQKLSIRYNVFHK